MLPLKPRIDRWNRRPKLQVMNLLSSTLNFAKRTRGRFVREPFPDRCKGLAGRTLQKSR